MEGGGGERARAGHARIPWWSNGCNSVRTELSQAGVPSLHNSTP